MTDPLPTIWNADQRIGDMLKGKRRLVVGIANAHYRAALEASVRYAAAAELGPRGIRVFAVSPGPLRTRAASGIAQFDELIADAKERAPSQRLVDIAEVGRVVAFLVSGASSGMTGDTIYVDAGLHHVA
jgi:enoyl-[acyl-carrier protein] reductase I